MQGGNWFAAVAATLLLAGCGGGAAKSGNPAECVAPEGAATDVRNGSSTVNLTFLTDVRVDSQTCLDRLVFAFRPDTPDPPAFRVSYQPASTALVQDGSGEPIQVAGSAYLVVRLEPAATAEAASDGSLDFTYTGPRRLAPTGTRFVRNVVKSGDFEAAVTWVVGLSEQRPFSVSTRTTPPRVVIDVG
jgi:hypothetical protein